MLRRVSNDKNLIAYLIGVALGDGNLTNPNGRAVKLRITCDKKYPKLIDHIKNSLSLLLPDNKVGDIDRGSCVDVYCHSNSLEYILGWEAKAGSKFVQKVRIPSWILKDKTYTKECLRGLVQTDGSIYLDRGYRMVNIVSNIPTLAESIVTAIKSIGYRPNVQLHNDPKTIKYTIRISRDTDRFIKDLQIWKK